MIFDVRYNISSLAFHDSMGRVLGASDLEYAGESKLPIEPAAVELAWNIAYMYSEDLQIMNSDKIIREWNLLYPDGGYEKDDIAEMLEHSLEMRSGDKMDIVYKRLTENELSRIIKMRIDQLTEEYTSEGRTVPGDERVFSVSPQVGADT